MAKSIRTDYIPLSLVSVFILVMWPIAALTKHFEMSMFDRCMTFARRNKIGSSKFDQKSIIRFEPGEQKVESPKRALPVALSHYIPFFLMKKDQYK